MAIDSISSSIINHLQSSQQHAQRHQAKKEMIQALIDGDLDATKAAFATLAGLSPRSQDPESDIAKFGVALQGATDITTAREAFLVWKPHMAAKINGTDENKNVTKQQKVAHVHSGEQVLTGAPHRRLILTA